MKCFGARPLSPSSGGGGMMAGDAQVQGLLPSPSRVQSPCPGTAPRLCFCAPSPLFISFLSVLSPGGDTNPLVDSPACAHG